MSRHQFNAPWSLLNAAILLPGMLLAGCGSKAPTATPAALSSTQAANFRITKALSEPTDMDFIETPLKDIAEALGIRHGMKVELDTEPLSAIGVSSDTPITYKATGLSLNSALGQILPPLKMSYIVDNGRLLITSAEKAKSR